ncbi:PSD1 and planctomycete cytochrome C domain-containing protein [Gimesia maris]|uniref:PSD1 and planctomycete cytochrome C domain-containing protein n=1 Tax=Gimesia maris TaxID=122 RepID=UPI003A90930F
MPDLSKLILLLILISSGNQLCAADQINFSHDILPILSDRCFHCHGPDPTHREADLRLDLVEAATENRDGTFAIAPGKPELSEVLARITSTDADLLMPPADSHRKPLTKKQIETIRQWIAEGAQWGKHWSFEPPVKVALNEQEAKLNPIDALVERKLTEERLVFSEPASRRTLIRRLSFDLTGLPPTVDEVEAFVNDKSPDADQKQVNRLLKSKHYGERMAMWWLDLARYSDTDGFQQDSTRTNWPWRDWVIQSFNENKPFDQFTIEQFAGDLLPNATDEQKLATCFHRNHMTNGEGGRDPEESRVDYVIDRVNTTGTVWLGLTLGCCQCHSHKFDPISQTDYYSLYAFFNSIDEDGKAGSRAKPYLKFQSPLAARAVKEAQQVVDDRKPRETAALQQAKQEFEPWLVQQLQKVQNEFTAWHLPELQSVTSVEGTRLSVESEGVIQARGPELRQDDYRLIVATDLPRVTGLRLEVFPHESHTAGKLSRGDSGEFILTDVKLQVRREGSSQLRDIDFVSAIADVEKDVKGRNYGKIKDTLDDDPRNGWTTETHDAHQKHVAVFELAEPLVLDEREELIFVMLHRSTEGNANIGRFRVMLTDQPGPAVRSLEPMPLEALAAAKIEDPEKLDAKLKQRLLDQFLVDHELYQQRKSELDQANTQLAQVKKAAGELNVMVLAERKEPRKTFVLERGVWDKHGKEVSRSVPAAVLALSAEKTKDRLDLAEWLVSRQNPLTARVVVNHLWQNCFGTGLVRTPGDFGLQGELPTHPDVLDWLAVELMEHDWDLQHILRLIVTSRTYQQQSKVTAELLERDPENRLLARGARFRLPSWMIRDAALQASGLLNPALGGPPVMPYQPQGVWTEMFMGRFRYEPSQGAAQYRRSLYAFWRRSSAPTFLFDSAQRRVCEVQPRRTNTPLQALTLLNDQSILESSRELARMAIQRKKTVEKRLDFIAQHTLSRTLQQRESEVLKQEQQQSFAYYRKKPDEALKLISSGQPPAENKVSPEELAAYMVVASMVFNLDEAMTHE